MIEHGHACDPRQAGYRCSKRSDPQEINTGTIAYYAKSVNLSTV